MKNIFYTFLFFCLFLQSHSQSFLWAQAQGGTGPEYSRHSITDAQGNTYVMGLFQDTMVIGSGSSGISLVSAGNTDIYIIKFTSSGNLLWFRQLGGPAEEVGNKMCFTPQGNILLCGSFQDTIYLGPGNSYTLAGTSTSHGFVLEFSSGG